MRMRTSRVVVQRTDSRLKLLVASQCLLQEARFGMSLTALALR